MTKLMKIFAVVAPLLSLSALASGQAASDPTRAELLYDTHCTACHTMQVHWRDKRQAYDWDSLKFQVRRWQGNAGLAWTAADIAEVSAYLNETIYRYPQPADRIGKVLGMNIQPVPRK